jgi:hypothetical protein
MLLSRIINLLVPGSDYSTQKNGFIKLWRVTERHCNRQNNLQGLARTFDFATNLITMSEMREMAGSMIGP